MKRSLSSLARSRATTIDPDLDTMTTELMVRVARLLPETHHGYYRESMDTSFEYTEDLDAPSPPDTSGTDGTAKNGASAGNGASDSDGASAPGS